MLVTLNLKRRFIDIKQNMFARNEKLYLPFIYCIWPHFRPKTYILVLNRKHTSLRQIKTISKHIWRSYVRTFSMFMSLTQNTYIREIQFNTISTKCCRTPTQLYGRTAQPKRKQYLEIKEK